jgi:hypothetical protein
MSRRLQSALSIRGISWTVAVVVACAAMPAGAEQLPSLYDKLQLSGSFTSVILGTNIRVDSERTGQGTDLDVEDDLGLDKSVPEPRFAARWRPGRKHEIEGGFQFAERSAEKMLERTISVADTTFDVGANVRTRFNTNQAFLTYRYAIFDNERSQIGAGLGLGAIFLGLGLDALASAGSSQVDYSGESDLIGPFGAIGIYGRVLSGERWEFEGDARVLKATVDRYTPRVLDFSAAARYSLSKRWAIEGGWGISDIKLDVGPKTSGDGFFSGSLEFSQQNIRLGAVFVP